MPAASPSHLTHGTVLTVHQGDCLTSRDPQAVLSTILGSCISACVFDRAAGLGGMNHFLLATQSSASRDKFGESARYGAFAMEQLINAVLTEGSGRKSDLEFKVFGGGNIHSGMTDVGAANGAFVREFLRAEGYGITAEDLGGRFARKVLFRPTDGKAFVKRLESADNARLVREEIALANRVAPRAVAEDVELF